MILHDSGQWKVGGRENESPSESCEGLCEHAYSTEINSHRCCVDVGGDLQQLIPFHPCTQRKETSFIQCIFLISANGEFPPVVSSTTRIPFKPTVTTLLSMGSPLPDKGECSDVWRGFCQGTISAFIVYQFLSAEDRAEGILLDLTSSLLEQ